jgi:hypothetical protein
MRMSQYQEALAVLPSGSTTAIQAALNAWVGNPDLSQVGQNICDETALVAADFAKLLGSFATELANGTASKDSWIAACRAHKRRGRQLPDVDCPSILGRARSLDDHANSVAKGSGGALTPAEAKRLLLKHAGGPVAPALDSIMRLAPLGNYLVWATFNANNPATDPFNHLPTSHGGICTALGLGWANAILILLVWSHAGSGSPSLHRPTVADAEVYPFYRPHRDASAPWGFTCPLPPNPGGLQPQPELVMPETTSQGLRLPFRVIRA